MTLLLLQHPPLYRNLHSRKNFGMHFALKPGSLLKLSIAFGRMPRETSRSKSWLEQYKDTSIILLPSITPDSNELLLPQLSYLIIKIFLSAMNTINCVVKYLEHDFPVEFFCWLGYIFIPFITATLRSYSTFIHGLLLVPLYSWNLFWHPNSQSIIDML